MKYDVTIGIPVYRSKDYIQQALESAFSQSYTSIEFLIVDDAGNEKLVSVEDDWLTENGLEVGSEWPKEI